MRGVEGVRGRAIVAALVAATIAVAPPIAGVARAVTADRLLIDSDAEFIGGGERTEFTDANAFFQFINPPLPNDQVFVIVSHNGENWNLHFKAPAGEELHVGHYPNAGVQPPLTPEVSVSTHSNGCGQSRIGSFTIQQLDRDADGHPIAFAATFEQWCDRNWGPLVGLVRVNSNVPQSLLSGPQGDRSFGYVTTGESEGPRTFTIESLGEVAVEVGGVAVTGAAASDFDVSDDECAGESLVTGETCTFDLTFAPSAFEAREATMVIANDAPQGSRKLPIGGWGRIPTSMAVRVAPDTIYINPGIRLISTVTPLAAGEVECLYDGEVLASGTLDGGSVLCVHERELGSHTFQARFLGTFSHGDSESEVLTFVVSSATAVDLTASKSSVYAGVPVTLTAKVSTASHLLYPGGSVTFRDVTTGQDIATRSIDAGSANPTISASFAAGTHQIRATYSGVNGILDGSSDTFSITVKPDTTAPTATAPKLSFPSNVRLSSGRLPIRLQWTGADSASGVASYRVARQTDGGAWSAPITVTAATSSALLESGHRYRYRVRALDRAGNLGAWTYGPTFSLRSYSEKTGAATYFGSWEMGSSSDFRGGHAKQAWRPDRKVRFTFTGRAFGWLSSTGLNGGSASIYVNGVYQATVKLTSADPRSQVVAWTKAWSSSASRTVEIRYAGPTSKMVTVDGFWVAR